MSIVGKLYEQKLISCADWLPASTIFECVMGSVAYGANLEKNKSDTDVVGICIPPREQIFPYLSGKIWGFDEFDEFKVWQQHHIFDQNRNEFDVALYNITHYFRLLCDNNPNIVDALFVPIDCVRKVTVAGNLLRDNRKMFLSQLAFEKFRGYAFSQLSKIRVITDNENEKGLDLLTVYRNVRRDSLTTSRNEINELKVDWKFVYHVVRLMLECEQILAEQDLDIRRNGEYLKQIRQGMYSLDEILAWFVEKEKYLEQLKMNCGLPKKVNKTEIRQLLTECLQIVYNDISQIYYIPENDSQLALKEIRMIMDKYGV